MRSCRRGGSSENGGTERGLPPPPSSNPAPAPSSGPFTGATNGDPVTLRLEVFVPGTVVSPGQDVNYAIDPAASTLDIGGAVDSLAGGNVARQNDFPVADGIRMFGALLASGGSIAFECGEATGTMFSPPDISMELGTWSASTFTSHNFLLTGNGGFVEILPIDVTAMPQPNGLVAAQAGETWSFQVWHRDSVMGQATSNFSDGVSVTFR